MRDIIYRYDQEQVRDWDLTQFESHLLEQLIAELRISPDGLTMRYPVWLFKRLSDWLPRRYVLVKPAGLTMANLIHLGPQETVGLWLIEILAQRSPAVDQALREKLLHVGLTDNSQLVRVEISWDTSRRALHAAI